MKKLLVVTFLLLLPGLAQATRIKDIAGFDGIRSNQLVGYGIVVGLNGSGDSDQVRVHTQSVINMLERMGITVTRTDIALKNVAAVTVTADLPPFAKQGSRIDVLVSSLGDAKSISGGTLVMSPLKGPDGQVYAVAQGPVVTNAFSYGAPGASAQKNHPTAGRITEGALVEREPSINLADRTELLLNLHQADFTTASRVAAAINNQFMGNVATCIDPALVKLTIPEQFRGRPVEFVAALERLEVKTDLAAKVVLNERTGTIIVGDAVRISTVAVSHGNLTLLIKENPQVSQPSPFAYKGETKVVPDTSLKVKEESGGLALMNEGTSIGEVVKALNTLGVTPRDLIAIMQALKAAGALQADLTVI